MHCQAGAWQRVKISTVFSLRYMFKLGLPLRFVGMKKLGKVSSSSRICGYSIG
jgi:hypothetical protein